MVNKESIKLTIAILQDYLREGDFRPYQDLGLSAYQKEAMATAAYPDLGSNVLYPAMGLAGEAGEALDKVKKNWRNQNLTSGQKYDPAMRLELGKEIGDVLWYAAALCSELGLDLGQVARLNLMKLADRKQRDVIKSEGDNR